MKILGNNNFNFLWVAVIFFVLSLGFTGYNAFRFFFGNVQSQEFVYQAGHAALAQRVQPVSPPVPVPAVVRAVYATGWSAGSKKYRSYVEQLALTSKLNAIVIDVKDGSGYVSYHSGVGQVQQYGAYQAQIANIDD